MKEQPKVEIVEEPKKTLPDIQREEIVLKAMNNVGEGMKDMGSLASEVKKGAKYSLWFNAVFMLLLVVLIGGGMLIGIVKGGGVDSFGVQ